MNEIELSKEEIWKIRNTPIGDYTLRDVQMTILSIMIEFDRICRKHGIKYVLDGGSMLGAVRHGGFIPWDDDMDVAMLRKDYNKFCKVCKTELGNDFVFETTKTNKYYSYNFGKLKKQGTIYEETFLGDIPINKGVWLDIFPLDNTNGLFFKFQWKLSRFWQGVRWTKEKVAFCECFQPRHTTILKIFSLLPFGLINFFQECSIRFLNLFKTKSVAKLCHPGTKYHSRNYYTNITEINFEGHYFFLPKEYDKWLTMRYGEYLKLPKQENRRPMHAGGKVKL